MATSFLARPPRSRVTRRKSTGVTRRTDTLELSRDVLDFGLEAMRQMAFEIAKEETARQQALDNPVSEIRIDGRANRPPADMEKRLSVRFGVIDARPAMARAKQVVEATTNSRYRWTAKDARLRSMVEGNGPVLLGYEEVVTLVTDDEVQGRRNIYYVHGFDRIPFNAAAEIYDRNARPRPGFVARAARRARAALKPDFTIAAELTGERNLSGGKSPFSGEPRIAHKNWSFIFRRPLGRS